MAASQDEDFNYSRERDQKARTGLAAILSNLTRNPEAYKDPVSATSTNNVDIEYLRGEQSFKGLSTY